MDVTVTGIWHYNYWQTWERKYFCQFFLSHFTNNDDNFLVEYSFPYEHLFVVSTHSHWYANVANYLAAGKLPTHLSRERKGKLFNKDLGSTG